MALYDRRGFIRDSVLYSGAALLAPSLSGLVACSKGMENGASGAISSTLDSVGGYGPVSRAGTELEIPRGFRYWVISRAGDTMSNGKPLPNAFDGMAAFAMPNGDVRLMRNHENRDAPTASTVKGNPSMAYDRKAGGGVSAVDVRIGRDGKPVVVKQFIALSGTIVNCAGGPTPWGSWLTCEEVTSGTAQGWERDHGYVFEVPANTESQVAARPLKAMGRFAHEAAAVDPETGIVYETEDLTPSGFYRFIPKTKGVLADGGTLQMLAVKNLRGYDTSIGQTVGQVLGAYWVTIPDPDPVNAATDLSAVHRQGEALGGASFARLEGCWYGDKSIYFNATSGGDARCGQVWQYRPKSYDEGELMLVFESPRREVMLAPDNITVSPRGGLVICEDTGGDQHLRGVTRDGKVFELAHVVERSTELCGACFSPDGRYLFFNTQGSTRDAGTTIGMTFAMTGPWEKGAL